MIIILPLLLNFIPAVITLGVMIHQAPYAWEDNYELGLFCAYISFVIAIDSCPEGWEIDKDFMRKSLVIRSKCKTMAESFENLMKWVEELPDILEKEEER